MTTKEVKEKTGLGLSTVQKYASILDIKYYGTGSHKVYEWTEKDIKRLTASISKQGRPPKKKE